MHKWLLVGLLATGCVPRAVTERLSALETRVAELERANLSEEDRAAADAITAEAYRRQLLAAEEALDGGDTAEALAIYREVATQAPDPRQRGVAERAVTELSVVGQVVEGWDEVEAWFQGEAPSLDGKLLVVFFESWCPHCRREVPLVDAKVEGRDTGVLLLTRMSHSTTPESMRAFLDENEVAHPVGVIPQDVSDTFAVTGVPAAALIEDGRIVWRGHPARLEGQQLDAFLPRVATEENP